VKTNKDGSTVKIGSEDIRSLLQMQYKGTVSDFQRSRLLVFGLIEVKDGVDQITQSGKEVLSRTSRMKQSA
jgi:hypothetical protein